MHTTSFLPMRLTLKCTGHTINECVTSLQRREQDGGATACKRRRTRHSIISKFVVLDVTSPTLRKVSASALEEVP